MAILKIKNYLDIQFRPLETFDSNYIYSAIRIKDSKMFKTFESFIQYKGEEKGIVFFVDLHIKVFHDDLKHITMSVDKIYIRNSEKSTSSNFISEINDIELHIGSFQCACVCENLIKII